MTDLTTAPPGRRPRLPLAVAANSRFMLVWPALALLLAVSAVFAPSSVSVNQIQSLLLFGGVLGTAALGQHLVVTVGGMDLSIAAVMTLSALLFVKNLSATDPGTIAGAVLGALTAAAAIGALNGVTVTLLRVTPLIATLGGAAIATGVGFQLQGEAAPPAVPESVITFINQEPLGIPIIAWFWGAGVLVVAGFLRYSTVGRRFAMVGTNPSTSRALGIRVDLYKVFVYIAGAVLAGIAGILLGMVVVQPGQKVGDPYLLPSIAAVAIGGTPLGGGLGSVIATAVGTLFVVQLNNFTLAIGGNLAVQQIVQGIVIVAAMALYNFDLLRSLVRIIRKVSPELPTEETQNTRHQNPLHGIPISAKPEKHHRRLTKANGEK
ncbi:ABC transporter permease [Arthrobacter sp. KNU40]|uniref:ABC transporter permease n=1 Tax=Arthrobacter sp. KNU40 TaxID=3447965 RepID=UPI003F600510